MFVTGGKVVIYQQKMPGRPQASGSFRPDLRSVEDRSLMVSPSGGPQTAQKSGW